MTKNRLRAHLFGIREHIAINNIGDHLRHCFAKPCAQLVEQPHGVEMLVARKARKILKKND